MGARIFSVKVIGVSVAVLSAAVALRLAAPGLAGFIAAEAPRVYGSVTTWLTPPYLYFIVNGIIISIAASARFQKPVGSSQPALDPVLSNPPPPLSAEEDLPVPAEYISKVSEDADLRPEFLAQAPAEVMNLSAAMAEQAADAAAEENEQLVIPLSNWSPRRSDSNESLSQIYANIAGRAPAAEKPSLSARLGRRRSIKSSPEGSI
ncbi:hypothetical protein AXF42_Ash016253 [Apostasia shenzhenica]|uniref:DUF4408 domain-containing protein n=1 Tax=Apostasia shenzhenica TaxID=1088818 RepID=A0A2H9ZXA7_9ASPA|nr:hypothetical protein AXF42_Ash016253 [Apostasia shenzhenica]